MKKMFLIVSLLLFYSINIFSQQTVGVLDISPRQGVSAMESEIVTDFVYTALYQYGVDKYKIISRQNRDAILAEHDFSLSGFCDEDSCALEVGKYLSADYVVIGTFTKFGSKYYLSLQLVDVNTTTISGSSRDGADNLDGIASTVVDNCVAGLFDVENSIISSKVSLEVGDSYAGGIIFYLDGSGGGLVCAESDQGENIEWGGFRTSVDGTSTKVGTGAANTTLIVDEYGYAEPYSGLTNYAARLCFNLELGGYSDWFLPSKDELYLMMVKLYKQGLGSFSSGNYWSSSEDYASTAWVQTFYLSSPTHSDYKNEHRYVRAVRAF